MKTRESGFVDYLLDFYGKGGIYTTPRDPFHRPMTRDEARRATTVLSAEKTFEGDTIDREKARELVLGWRESTSGSSSAFEKAKAEGARLEKEMEEAEAVVRRFPRGPTGLTPDAVKVLPEYQAAKTRTSKAFARLRAFNAVFTKKFAKEIRAERAAITRRRMNLE